MENGPMGKNHPGKINGNRAYGHIASTDQGSEAVLRHKLMDNGPMGKRPSRET